MMSRPVYIIDDHILSPLGEDTDSNWKQVLQGKTGLSAIKPLFPAEFTIQGAQLSAYPERSKKATRLENMFLYSIQEAMKNSGLQMSDSRLMVFVSTTKGNIDLLGKDDKKVHMHALANCLKEELKLKHAPVIVSNACISGVLAIQTASLYIRHGWIDHAIVTGGDLFSKFTLSGFYAFKALSAGMCKPFDKSRDGINLGEGVGTVILTSDKEKLSSASYTIEITGAGSSNDANHISGPSRDGSGLALSIRKALKNTRAEEIDGINAHGTGTLYNDNMESLAFQQLGLSNAPLNSYKAYYGHTLGAAGIIETILGIRSMLNNTLIKSLGFDEQGTEGTVNVIKEVLKKDITYFLKTASGFGGCNAALVLKKHA